MLAATGKINTSISYFLQYHHFYAMSRLIPEISDVCLSEVVATASEKFLTMTKYFLPDSETRECGSCCNDIELFLSP